MAVGQPLVIDAHKHQRCFMCVYKIGTVSRLYVTREKFRATLSRIVQTVFKYVLNAINLYI